MEKISTKKVLLFGAVWNGAKLWYVNGVLLGKGKKDSAHFATKNEAIKAVKCSYFRTFVYHHQEMTLYDYKLLVKKQIKKYEKKWLTSILTEKSSVSTSHNI